MMVREASLVCKRCSECKPETAFEVRKQCKSGRDGTCRECRNSLARELRGSRAEREAAKAKRAERIAKTCTKPCNRCGCWKPFSEYDARAASADGLHFSCRDCLSVYYSEQRYKRLGVDGPRIGRSAMVGDDQKRCSKCNEPKQLTAFNRRKGYPGGVNSICLACEAAHMKRVVEQRKARTVIPIPPQKQCPRCGETKVATCFAYCRSRRDGLTQICRQCSSEVKRSRPDAASRRNERQRLRYATDPEYKARVEACKVRRRMMLQAAHEHEIEEAKQRGEAPDYTTRRAIYKATWKTRKVDGSLRMTHEQWREIKAVTGHVCLRCGRPEPTIRLTIDHIVPVIHGGDSSFLNVQPLCGSCNPRKNAQTIDYRVNFPELLALVARWKQEHEERPRNEEKPRARRGARQAASA